MPLLAPTVIYLRGRYADILKMFPPPHFDHYYFVFFSIMLLSSLIQFWKEFLNQVKLNNSLCSHSDPTALPKVDENNLEIKQTCLLNIYKTCQIPYFCNKLNTTCLPLVVAMHWFT